MAVRIESQAEPIPGYKLLERLGGGGFGEVWKAVAPGGLQKAIKFVYGDLQTTSDEGMRAEQELKALSRVKTVRHPYILSLERFDIIEGQLIIVMELADRNLWDRFRECRSQGLPGIPRDELMGYMDESAEALDLMNIQYQLQHLDIKPQNIFLVHNHIKVADFGLVKDLEGMVASVTGGVTPVYAAPETFDGWVSRFCDQYSLGILYQELLTGQRPFCGTNVRQLIVQHLQGTPNLEPLPPGDRAAIARALAKNPDERHPSCQDLVRTLRAGSPASPATTTVAVSEPSSSGRAACPKSPPTHPDAGAVTDATVAENAAPSPALASPSELTQQPGGDSTPDTEWIRTATAEVAKGAHAGASRIPAAEMHGEGVLFPALLIGLGQMGGAVLQQFRESIQDQRRSLDDLPNLRLLVVDTDPEIARSPSHGKATPVAAPSDVLLARLNRPSHYLRSREGRTRIDTWFNLKMLYRIPRTPVTTGLRALGRLAFFDHYPLIAARLRQELEACTAPDALTTAARQSGLKLRGNQPRVYVVCSLAGGTGSGMFLDVAYVVRSLLKDLGYQRPEIVGLFLLPAVERSHPRTLAMGNAFAALTELNHFCTAGNTFAARYDEHNPALVGSGPPYDRCILLPLPARAEEGTRREVLGCAADFLYRNLLTPLGRTADLCRAQAGAPAPVLGGPLCQTFGLYRVYWPRRPLLQRVGRRLCQQLVQRWMTKDSKPVRETVQTWAAEQWAKLDLGAEFLIAHLQKACEVGLGQAPETLFDALTGSLEEQVSSLEVAPLAACLAEALDGLEQIVGRADELLPTGPTPLQEALDKRANALVVEWGGKLAELAVRLIEQPEFRLAGAEEALRQVIATIEQVLQHHEPLAKELATRAGEAQVRIKTLLTALAECPPGHRRIGTLVVNLLELLRFYPRWRYQSLTLQRVITTYLSLRGQLSDQLREINFCRARLADLLNTFREQPGSARSESSQGRGRSLLPPGCSTLEEAIQQFQDSIGPEEFKELDQQVQEMIRRQFTALVHVCLTPSNLLKDLEVAMQREAEAFAAVRLAGTNVVDMYLAQNPSDEEVLADLVNALDEAAADLASSRTSRSSETQVLLVPAGPAAERLGRLAQQSLPKVQLITDADSDEIVFYREMPHLDLAELEQLGPLGYEAYRQMSAVEHFTPHSRSDITQWQTAGRAAR